MAKKSSIFARFLLVGVLTSLCACGGGGDEQGGGDELPQPTPGGIGAAGGTVSAQGASVLVPAGALAASTNIAVTQTSTGAPALPAGFSPVGSMFAFTPHGTAFSTPATITLPFDPAGLPAGAIPQLYKTNAQDQWEPVANAVFGAASVSAQVSGFSFAQILVPPLTSNEPTRVWSFGAFPGTGGAELDFGGGTRVGGILDEAVEFGFGLDDIDIIGLTRVIPFNNRARGYVFGTADGVTYGVYTEAPFAPLGESAPIGSISRLVQVQSFVKRSANATLRFSFTQAQLGTADFNLFARSVGQANTTIRAEVYAEVIAFTQAGGSFFHTAGGALVGGHRGQWDREVWNYHHSRTPLWTDANFTLEIQALSYGGTAAQCFGDRGVLELQEPRVFVLDLSSVAVGEEFTLYSEIFATTNNRRGGGPAGDCEASGANAYLRDPLEIGGATVEISGLDPTNRPLLSRPAPAVLEPAACTSNSSPDPASGTLQFAAATFSTDEFAGATPAITVTRSGGSRGAVTATFATGGGTASTSDFTPIEATVFFADGDDSPRRLAMIISPDDLDEANETVNLSLSDVGGCAVLGAQGTATLTIVDDDLPPPTGLPGALDSSFGEGGKASLPAFGGDRSAMALQADGRIVLVGGTFADFVLARFNADGSVDHSFDGDGRVTTDMQSGAQEEALAVAMQPDGRIVVAGYSGTGSNARIALVRYLPDGSLDASFGNAGRLLTELPGIAYAVAIQPDGKIVVAGDSPRSLASDFSDFVVARFQSDGTPDASFAGGAARVFTDIGGGTNTARNLALQPDGGIVVSGEPVGTFTGSDHTDIVRYSATGVPDVAFGTGGKVTLTGMRVGEGLVVQADGKLILAGSVDIGTAPNLVSHFALRRLNADGTPDPTFGTAGAASTSFTERGDVGLAVTQQADGRILVAGRSAAPNANFAVARFLPNGTLDTAFANAGKQTVDFFGSTDIGENILVQADGRILVSGQARDNVDGYGVARMNP